MQPCATATLPLSLAPAPAVPASHPESIRHLPAAAHAAYEQFQAGGDPVALGPVVLAILTDFSPRRSAVPLGDLPGDTQLIADLGFDSLAITEVVFTAEDLFGISITNDEIVQVRTLADLLGFIQVKVADRRVA
jgi:acyl carrier protein